MALTPEDWAKAQEETAQYTDEQQKEYIQYIKFTNSAAGAGYPKVSSIEEFFRLKNANQIVPTAYQPIGATSYIPSPEFDADWWQTEAGQTNVREPIEPATQEAHTLAEWQEFAAYMKFLREGGIEQGYPVPRDIMDYFGMKADMEAGKTAQPGQYQSENLPPTPEWEQQQKEQQEREQQQAEQDEYSKWVQERSRYAAEEQYREPTMYRERFAQWLHGQGDVSGALREYIESKYPSLQARFGAGMPRETGYYTREEARTAAAQREGQWKAWLSKQRPEIYQDYMGQRPSARGEKYWEYSPSLRSVNF